MKTHRLFWLLTTAPALMVPFASGCSYVAAPDPAPTPTPAPTPKAPYFDPAAGQPRGFALNNNPVIPTSPVAFRIASAVTGDTIAIQSVSKAAAAAAVAGTAPAAAPAPSASPTKPAAGAKPSKTPIATSTPIPGLGAPDVVRLAGIIAAPTDPGLQGARTAIASWTAGQDVDIDVDAKYPTDLDGKRLVEVFFKGRKGPFEGQTLSLNRMLIRSGWAVVDLYSPTSFDTTQWIYDEAHAKRMKLGIWKYGQVVQQRVNPLVKANLNAKGKSKISITTNSVTRTSERFPTPAPSGSVGGSGRPGQLSVVPPSGGPVNSSASSQSVAPPSAPVSSGASSMAAPKAG